MGERDGHRRHAGGDRERERYRRDRDRVRREGRDRSDKRPMEGHSRDAERYRNSSDRGDRGDRNGDRKGQRDSLDQRRANDEQKQAQNKPQVKGRWTRMGQDTKGGNRAGKAIGASTSGLEKSISGNEKPDMEDMDDESRERVEDVQKPNFESTGALDKEVNTMNGVVLKWCEPPEARKPKTKWTIFPFKGDESLDPMKIYGKASYLLGRERRVVDIPLDHPSCSSQHAVICFRLVDFVTRDGVKARQIKPFLLDLESSNGTVLNGEKIESRRYIELRKKDVIKFADSTREYVIVNDKS